MQDRDTELKPCPFCGGKVKVQSLDGFIRNGKRKRWCVVCWDCDLFFGLDLTYGGDYATKQGCADDWNKRVVQNETH